MRGWKAECSRFFFSRRFWLTVFGVAAALFFSIVTEPNFPRSMEWETVYDYFTAVFFGMPLTASLMLCSIPYGLSFCDDIEYRYIYAISSRQSTGRFLLRRLLAIFLSSWLVMVIAMMACALILHIWVPWCDVTDLEYIENVAECGGFYDMLMKKEGSLFFLVLSMEFAMLPGILSVLAAGISIAVPDRLLTLSIPFLVVYMTLDLSVMKGMNFLNIRLYYDVMSYDTDKDYLVLCQGILLTAAIFLITYIVSYFLLKRRIENG